MNTYMYRAMCPTHGKELITIEAIRRPIAPSVCTVDNVSPLTDVAFTSYILANPAELNDNIEGLIADIHNDLTTLRGICQTLQTQVNRLNLQVMNLPTSPPGAL